MVVFYSFCERSLDRLFIGSVFTVSIFEFDLVYLVTDFGVDLDLLLVVVDAYFFGGIFKHT